MADINQIIGGQLLDLLEESRTAHSQAALESTTQAHTAAWPRSQEQAGAAVWGFPEYTVKRGQIMILPLQQASHSCGTDWRHIMRKRIGRNVPEGAGLECNWLNVEELVEVEITSEDASHPIESALVPGGTSGWRAAEPGEQTIRLWFDHPQQLRRIWISFIELENERTQEYVLRWSSDNGEFFHEIVRQQWNFSPPNTTNEIEDHRVELPAAKILELTIKPDIRNERAFASLANMRLA
jgi:hypothetical protein